MMKSVLIDICHTPQYNFYKALILRLAAHGCFVYVTVMDRGRLVKIVHSELDGVENVHIIRMGRHRMKKWAVILESNLWRIVQMVCWGVGHKVDIVYGNGFIPHIVGWMKRVPRYAFGDDPQTFDYRPKLALCTQSCYCLFELPEGMRISSKARVLPVLKEWAYLNSRTFSPNVTALEPYGLEPHSYIFVREVSVGTLNYSGQAPDSILQIADMFPKGVRVVLSLEKKDKRDQYPKEWILLQEPVGDIHSLIYYSCGLVSSGDSMAREAALLGVPSYYLGIRYDMPANLAAAKVASLQNRQTADVRQWLQQIAAGRCDVAQRQQAVRHEIDSKFMDINEYMYSLVKQE